MTDLKNKTSISSTRRHFLKRSAQILASLGLSQTLSPFSLFGQIQQAGKMPTRPLGKTGHHVTLFSLGGEGILRTYGRKDAAVKVIQKALDLGVNYCDTAPAYAESQDYYSAVLASRRKEVFQTSKTHERTRDGSLQLLQDSLKRLRTDYLDLWQLHDLRTKEDLDEIFGKGGALEALEEAKRQKMVRFTGITGHHDPDILLEAMRRYPFDTVLCAVNAADKHALSFIDTVIPKALEQNMGIIAMKVLGRGQIFRRGGIETPEQAISYVLSLPVSTALIGCSTPEEVIQNVEIAKQFRALAPDIMKEMERITAPYASEACFFKAVRP